MELHIVFAPKYRRQVIYGQIKADIGKILRQLCEQKKVNIIEAEACPDHIHYAGRDTAAYERGKLYGIFERKEFPDDI